jgi:hypothetical protein
MNFGVDFTEFDFQLRHISERKWDSFVREKKLVFGSVVDNMIEFNQITAQSFQVDNFFHPSMVRTG